MRAIVPYLYCHRYECAGQLKGHNQRPFINTGASYGTNLHRKKVDGKNEKKINKSKYQAKTT